jgi:hypothetical protein
VSPILIKSGQKGSAHGLGFLPALCCLLAIALSSCGGNCGPIPFCLDLDHQRSKEELAQYHSDWSQSGYEPVGYRGSDATHHHFIARPIDWFTHFTILKSELPMKDERPLLGGIGTHYRVNPMMGFWEPVDEAGNRLR